MSLMSIHGRKSIHGCNSRPASVHGRSREASGVDREASTVTFDNEVKVMKKGNVFKKLVHRVSRRRRKSNAAPPSDIDMSTILINSGSQMTFNDEADNVAPNVDPGRMMTFQHWAEKTRNFDDPEVEHGTTPPTFYNSYAMPEMGPPPVPPKPPCQWAALYAESQTAAMSTASDTPPGSPSADRTMVAEQDAPPPPTWRHYGQYQKSDAASDSVYSQPSIIVQQKPKHLPFGQRDWESLNPHQRRLERTQRTERPERTDSYDCTDRMRHIHNKLAIGQMFDT